MFVGRITLFGASLLTVSLVGLVAADGGPNTTTVVPATANSTPFPQALQSAGPAPLSLRSKLLRPKLYDNTEICTPKVMSLAVGGKSSPPPPLSLRDWFTTAGGLVTGFDFYVVNGGPGAVPNDIHSMQFYDGTARIYLGTLIIDPYPASFSTRSPTPRLSPIPVHRDPVTGEPRMMRVSVDYTVGTYTIVDARTQELLVGPEDIGPDRVPFQLPPGHVGVDLRFTGEASLCAGGSPVCGVVLARGGSGNEDGLHITNATQCIPEAWELVCDNLEWAPTDPPPPAIGEPVPCVGGGVCSLGRPHFGIALTLYTELEDPLPPAIETVSLDQPNPPESCCRISWETRA